MKLIDQYKGLHKQLEDKLSAGTISLEELCVLQEVKYRIGVLDTLRAFCTSAPKTTDTTKLCYHYQLVSTYLKFVCSERRFGTKADEDGQKKRETAVVSLERVVTDWTKRFSSFKADTEDLYKTRIVEFINSVLSVWIQYRNTYINI